MHIISDYIEFILHLNTHLIALISYFGPWIYVILFLVIFLETGVVFTPFLPGESLLFALGTLCATNVINVHLLVTLLMSAAILGGFLNYAVGFTLGKHLFSPEKKSIYNNYIQQTHDFYQKHGALTIILARLIPFIRTYAPFVAGIARMNFLLFSFYNIIGGILWIGFFLYISYFFGNIPIIKQHFSLVVLAIIILSVIPLGIEIYRHFVKSRNRNHEHTI